MEKIVVNILCFYIVFESFFLITLFYSQLSFGQGLGDIVMVGFFLFTILVALTLLMFKNKN